MQDNAKEHLLRGLADWERHGSTPVLESLASRRLSLLLGYSEYSGDIAFDLAIYSGG
jgi:hypothetical protein